MGRSKSIAAELVESPGALAVPFLAVLGAFAAARFLLFPPALLPDPWVLAVDQYRGPGILAEAITRPGVAILVVSAFVALALNSLPSSWNRWRGRISWGDGVASGVRPLLFVATLPVMWQLSTYDLNLFLDQAHSLDRIALVLCWAGILLNPAFVPLFLALAAMLASQFAHPACLAMPGDEFAFTFGLLLLFWVAFLLSRVIETRVWVLPAVVLMQWAAFIAWPAFHRIGIGLSPTMWALNNRPGNRLIGAHLNGWMHDTPTAKLLDAARTLDAVAPVAQLVVLAFGIGACAVLFHRRVALALACGALFGEALTFSLTGVVDWPMVFPSAALCGLLYATWSKGPVAGLFTRRNRMWSAAVIVCGLPIFGPPGSEGFASRLYVAYDLEVEDATRTRYELDRRAVEPFDAALLANHLEFADPTLRLPVDAHGRTTQRALFRLLQEAGTSDDIEALRGQYGAPAFDRVQTDEFAEFLRRYFASWNAARGRSAVVPSSLRAPPRTFASVGGALLPGSSPIRRVRLHARDVLYDGRELHVLDDRLLLEVRVPIPEEIIHD